MDIGFAPIGLDMPYRVYVSEDPSGFGGGDVNLYLYAGGNPVNYFDPNGNDRVTSILGITGGVAGTIGMVYAPAKVVAVGASFATVLYSYAQNRLGNMTDAEANLNHATSALDIVGVLVGVKSQAAEALIGAVSRPVDTTSTISVGVGGFMVSRVGKLHLYQET